MDDLAAYSVRMALCGLAALLATACVRLAPATGYLARQEPRVGQPPLAQGAPAARKARASADAARLRTLERDVAALDADLVHLRLAIETMGPLAPPEDFFIPVEPFAVGAPSRTNDRAISKITIDEFGAGIPAGDLVAAAAPKRAGAPPMFYEIRLGGRQLTAAEAGRRQGVPENRLAGLEPLYDRASSPLRLSAGLSPRPSAVDAACVDLALIASTCHVAAPAGVLRQHG